MVNIKPIFTTKLSNYEGISRLIFPTEMYSNLQHTMIYNEIIEFIVES